MDVRKALRGGAVCFAFFTCAAAIATPVYGDVSRTLAGSADALVWLQQKLTESGGVYGDYFGNAVAISRDGSTALVDASSQDNGQGVVYVLTRTGKGWQQVAELSPSDGTANEHFGTALALSSDGSTALLGAWNQMINGTAEQGAAYVFTTSDDWKTHAQVAELIAGDGGTQDDFGNSVALSADGSTALVGSPSGGNIDQGTAYIFTSPDGWATHTLAAELTASNAVAGNSFGIGVALSGNGAVALVGEPGRTVNGNPGQGAAYIFSPSSGSWSQVAELAANDGASEDVFGNRMALSADGSTALISALGKNNWQGAAYIFTTSDDWATNTQAAELTASNGEQGDQFGYGVALSADGTAALVGSPSATVGGNVGQGATYLYTDSSGAWTQTDELSARDGVAYDTSSTVVSLSNDGTLLTSDGCHPYDQNTYTCGPGAAYAFKASDLSAALSTPTTVQSDAQFDSKYIVTNASATASGAVSVELPVPGTSVGYVSSIASQGTCSYDSSSHAVDCALGSIAGNGGTAWASLTLKATGTAGTTIDQSAQVANAKPDLAQKGYTTITKASSGGSNNSSTDGGGGAFGWLGLLALLAVAILLGRDSTNTRDHAPQS